MTRVLETLRYRDGTDEREGLFGRVEDTQPGVRVAGAALSEEVVHELGAAHAGVGVEEAEDASGECDLD